MQAEKVTPPSGLVTKQHLFSKGVSLSVGLGKAYRKGLAEIRHQVRKKTLPRSSTTYQNKIKPVKRRISFNQSHYFPQPAASPVANYGVPDLFGNSKPNTCGIRILTPEELKDKARHRRFTPPRSQKEKLFPILQTLGPDKHRSRFCLTFTPVHSAGLPLRLKRKDAYGLLRDGCQ